MPTPTTDEKPPDSKSSTPPKEAISPGTAAPPAIVASIENNNCSASTTDAPELPGGFDWLNLDDHAILHSVRASWTSFEAVLGSAAGYREPLGELLLKARRITRQQRDFSLAEQKKGGEKLGELLVRFGWLTSAELNAVLALQHRQDGTDGPLRLGNILRAMGVISSEQLEDAILRQRFSSKRLGEVLVEAGHAQASDVLRGLSVQRRLQKAALSVLLSFATMAAPPIACADGHAGSISVSASVLPSAQLRIVSQSAQLAIAPADIRRGFIEVPASTQIEVDSNSREGFALTVDTVPTLFKAVQITGLDGVVELGAEGGTIVQRRAGRQAVSLQLSYRFILSEGVRPGNYAWPIALSVRPL